MLKKVRLFGIVCLIMAAMVSFTSCSKEKQIIGKWEITKAIVEGDGDSFGPGDYTEDGGTWVFRDGGKCTLHITNFDVDGTYSYKKDYITVDLTYGECYKLYGDLDIDEINRKEMSISGTLTAKYWEPDDPTEIWTEKMKLNYQMKKK